MPRYELVEGTSSKFWEIVLQGASFTVTFGRIGTNGQTQTKAFDDDAKAKVEYEKLVKEKTKKGYAEVGGNGATTAPPAAPPTDAPKATVKAEKPKAEKKPTPAPVPDAPALQPIPAGDGWMDAGNGYALSLRDGRIVARNAKGKELSSLPKELKDSDVVEALEGAREFLASHDRECRETVETWMLRSLPVPRKVLDAVWPDPSWRAVLENAVVTPITDGTPDHDAAGLLRGVDPARGFGVVTLDGETLWSKADSLSIPHPILLAELDDWRALCAELGLSQGLQQLFRETFPRPAGKDTDGSVDDFSGGDFDMLSTAMNEARRLGYRVSGGTAICRVWESKGQVEARFDIGEGDPMYETTTGDLAWVDSKQRPLPIGEVGPVAFSEGMRMASAIYAKRKVASAGDDD